MFILTSRFVLTTGNQRWDREKQARRIKQIADWNTLYGGGLKTWCAEFGVLGSGQGGVMPEHRYEFIRDLRELFEEQGIGWAYWSFNEVFTVLRPDVRTPFAPATPDWVDQDMLEALGLSGFDG